MSDNFAANKRIAKNSIVLSIQMVFVLLLTLYTTRVILNILGVDDYGVYNAVCGFVAMFSFLNTSMSNGIQRFFNFELGKNGEDGACKVFNTSIFIQGIFAILIVLLTETIGLWFLYEKMVIPAPRMEAAFWIFQFSIISFLFIIFQAPFRAVVMAHEKMTFYAIISILDAVLKLLIVFALSYLGGDKLIVYGLLFTFINVLDLLLYFIYCKRFFFEIKFRAQFDKKLFHSMLGFSGWNIFGSFANMMREQGINIILNLFFGPIVNAARGVAAQVNGGLQAFVYNLTAAIRPQVVQSYAQGNTERTMRLTFSISKLSCFCLYLLSLPVLLDIDFILKIWLNNNVPEHTSSFVYIIVLTSFLNNLNAAVSGVVHASGKMKVYQLTGCACIMVAIPIAYVALEMGVTPEWALIICSLGTLVAQIVALWVLKSIVDYSIIDYLKKVIWPLLLVVLLSLWISLGVHRELQEGYLRFVITGLTSVVIVSVLIYFLGLDKDERYLVKQMALKLLRR